MTEPVTISLTRGIAEVTLSRPEKLNAMSRLLIKSLTATITNVSGDDTLRCVVISGAGRAFSAGADVVELKNLTLGNAEKFIRLLHRACQAVRDCPVPVIAKIDGPCLGGALELAVSCDMRGASERSTFAMPEVQVGIPSVIEAALLPRLMGWGRASELLYTGRTLTAEEALDSGIIEKIAPPSNLDHAVAAWTDAILSASPKAIRAQKRLMRRWEQVMIDEAIEVGVASFREAYSTDEPRIRLE